MPHVSIARAFDVCVYRHARRANRLLLFQCVTNINIINAVVGGASHAHENLTLGAIARASRVIFPRRRREHVVRVQLEPHVDEQ